MEDFLIRRDHQKLQIKSKEKIIEFLSSQQTGRVASLDEDGFPQIIPMNFVFINDAIYMHSHIRGEKLDNIRRNQKVGFEVDKSLVEVIKIVPESLTGKYKIGQNMDMKSRVELAKLILERNSSTAKETLDVMGFKIVDNELKLVDDIPW